MFTLDFSKLSKDSADLAGGKGASLGEMTRAGIPVPSGFVVLANAFEEFLSSNNLTEKIAGILRGLDWQESKSLEESSEKIKKLIFSANLPLLLEDEINRQFSLLDTEVVAVRSSATAEDSGADAWAGQLDSFLNATVKNLILNIKNCWASLFNSRAIFYRFEKGLHDKKISVAVVVQTMIQSEVSGIAFSVHPVTENRDQIIIEAGFGLGEAIVSGQVTPDSYVVDKNNFNIIDCQVNIQKRGIYRGAKGWGSDWQEINLEKGKQQCLSDSQIKELARLIVGIENHYDFPCDIEWALVGGNFYIVQSRPITTLVATGNASTSLKTGDRIEVNANQGVVKVIKKK